MIGLPAREPVPTAVYVPVTAKQHLVLAGLLGCYAVAVLVGILVSGRSLGAIVALAFCLAFFVQFWPILFPTQERGWFHPLVFSSVMLSVPLLRSFPTYAFGLEWNAGLPARSEQELDILVVYALLLLSVSRASYYVGYYFGRHEQLRSIVWPTASHVGAKAAVIICLACAVIGVHLMSQGGSTQYLKLLSLGRSTLVDENLLFGEWALFGHLAVVACLVWWSVGTAVPRNPFFWAAAVVSLALLHFETGSRSAIVQPLLLGWMIHVFRSGRLQAIALPVLLAIVLVLIGALGVVRAAARTDALSLRMLADASVVEYATIGTEELVERSGPLNPIYPILAKVPDEIPLLKGQAYVALAVTWIPRRIWPDKPRSTGALVGETFLATNAPVPPGAIGEAYWNFHIPGVIAAFLLLGFVHRRLANFLARSSGAAPAVLVYVTVLYKFSPDVLSIIQSVHLLFCIAVVLCALGILPSRKTAPATGPAFGATPVHL